MYAFLDLEVPTELEFRKCLMANIIGFLFLQAFMENLVWKE